MRGFSLFQCMQAMCGQAVIFLLFISEFNLSKVFYLPYKVLGLYLIIIQKPCIHKKTARRELDEHW